MAKVCFYLPDGGEKTFRLFLDRPLKVGRDPGNDAVLRDAKVSRRHAEVVFERGFFVIHDLGSSNGTYVNGRRVRIAPLTDGSELRLGATLGRFIEEAAPGAKASSPPREVYEDEIPSGTVAMPSNAVIDFPPHARGPQPPSRDEPRHRPDADDDERFETRPHSRGSHPPEPDEEELEEEGIPRTLLGKRPRPEPSRPERPKAEDRHRGDFDDSEFSIESPTSERSVVMNASSVPIFYFRRPVLFTTFLACMIALAMVAAGATTAVVFFAQGHVPPALVAVALTIIFTSVALILVPPRNIELFRDEEMTDLAMTIWQESRAPFPSLRYCARTDDGVTIAYFHKSFFGNAGRRRWWILDQTGRRIACAVENGLFRSFVRKFVGGFSSSLTTDFLIDAGDRIVGIITRRATSLYRSVLSLYDRGSCPFDPRVAVALAVLIESIERR